MKNWIVSSFVSLGLAAMLAGGFLYAQTLPPGVGGTGGGGGGGGGVHPVSLENDTTDLDDDAILLGDATSTPQLVNLPDCNDFGDALNYDAPTNAITCRADVVTSSFGGTGLSAPVVGQVVLTNGTSSFITQTLLDDQVLLGAGFLPTPPVSTTIPDCDTAGDALNYDAATNAFSCQVIPGGGTHPVALASDVSGILPTANGGTGLVSPTAGRVLLGNGALPLNLQLLGDDTVLLGSATIPTSATIPDCNAASEALNYDQPTNAFSCQAIVSAVAGFGTAAGETEMINTGDDLLFGTGTTLAETRLYSNWPSFVVAVGVQGNVHVWEHNLEENTSGTHPEMIGTLFQPLNLTAAGAGTTLGTTVKIEGGVIGAVPARNYGLHVAADVRIDGRLTGSDASPNGLRFVTGGLFTFNETSPTPFSTAGLVVDQLANDNHIQDFKSSDVLHGLTGRADDDTYLYFEKFSATAGGARLTGISEATVAMAIQGVGDTQDTAKSTAATGAVSIAGAREVGTVPATLLTNQNVVVMRNGPIATGSFTEWILDADGDTWQTGVRHSDISTIVLGAAAATFAITTNQHRIDGDAGGNSVTTITAGRTGQLLTLIFIDASVTIVDNDGNPPNTINLAGVLTDFTGTAADVVQLIFDGTSWFEVSRSVN